MKKYIAAALILTVVIAGSCIFGSDDNNREVENTYDVWGTVTDSFGHGLPGVTITISFENGTRTASTDSSGAFSFTGIKGGACSLIPGKNGYIFDPAQSDLTIDGQLQSGIKFIALPAGQIPYGSISAHEGANENISLDNVDDVNERVLTSYLNIVRLLENSAAKTAEATGRRVDGSYSGHAAVEHEKASEGNVDTDTYTGDLFDYSDDGELFLGGRLSYTTHENTSTGEKNGEIVGTVGVAGAYQGTLSYDIEKGYGNAGAFSGTYHAISDSGAIGGGISSDDYDSWEIRAGEKSTYSLSGKITDDSGSPIPDVTVSLDDTGGTVMTDKEGGYWFGNLANGSYLITPSLTGYTFSPSSTMVTVSGSDVRANITGIPTGGGRNISGRIIDAAGNGIAGISLSLTSAAHRFVTYTGDDGNYLFANVPDAGYSLLPISDTYTFQPQYRTLVLSGVDLIVDNFIASGGGTSGDGYSISGNIHDQTGDGIPDVTVTLSGVDRTTYTDKEGNYYFGNVPFGTYTVTPMLEGYMFLPGSGRVSVEGEDARADFIGSLAGGYTVSGRVINFAGDGIGGTTLIMSSRTRQFTAITDAQGQYQFLHVLDGSYGLEPDSNDYNFTPPLRTVIVNGADYIVEHFTGSSGGSEGEYSIAGRFLDPDGIAIPDVMVILDYDDRVIAADKEGNYYFGNLGNGDYRVTPSLQGYAFSPAVRMVTIEGGNQRADFTGVLGGEGHLVRGMVVDQAGAGIAEIELSLTSTINRFTAVTDEGGFYIFPDVPDGAYGLLPISDRYLFTPTYQNIVVDGIDSTADVFIGSNLYGEYSIYGRIFNSDNGGLADVTVLIEESGVLVLSDKDGNFYLDHIRDGAYTLIPSMDGYRFSPARATILVAGSDVRADFSWSVAGEGQYSLYGRVVDEAGTGMADVTLMIGFEDSVKTDKEGSYYAGNLEEGVYLVIPRLEGYSFSPQMQIASIDDEDVYLDAFVARPGSVSGHSIMGAVADAAGGVLADVTVAISGTDRSTRTDKDGSYYFGNLENGEYTIVPTLDGYTFSPPSQTIIIAGEDMFAMPFIGTRDGGGSGSGSYTVSGRVTDAEGAGLCCVTLTLSGDNDLTTVSDSEGRYAFTNIENGDYMLIPMRIGTVFSPIYQTVAVRGGDVTVNFTVSSGSDDQFYTVEGRVNDESGDPVEGVTITLNGGESPRETTTNSTGTYQFTSTPSGMYVVTATKDGYSFSPRFQQINVAGGNFTQNFIASGVGGDDFAISGRVVTEDGLGLPEVSVGITSSELQGQLVGRTTTGTDGSYQFDDMFPGQFTITVNMSGYSFDPASVTITVGEEPVTVQDIVGARTAPVDIRTTSMTISTSGGTIWVRNDRGDEISLEIPPLAILGSELITLTTLAEPPENPIANNIFPGVTIEPEGLLLNSPAILRVTFAEPPANLDNGTLFLSVMPDYVLPAGEHVYTFNSIEGEIYHFSTYSAGIATMNEVSSQIDKALLNAHSVGKPAFTTGVNYGWQITRANIMGLLHWADRSLFFGNNTQAKKAIDEAKKVVEEDAETFVDEVIPPVNPCEDKDYLNALGKYWETLTLLGSEGSVMDKVDQQVKNVADQCTVRLTMDVDFSQTEQADDFLDTFEYEGTVTIYMPIFGR